MKAVRKSGIAKYGKGRMRMIKILLFAELLGAFYLLFYGMARTRFLSGLFYLAQNSMENIARKRVSDYQKSLLLQRRRKGILFRVEKALIYSGLGIRYPRFTPEIAITLALFAGAAVYFVAVFAGGTLGIAGLVVAALYLGIYVVVQALIVANFKRTDEELLKFLDFLGNYSITSGEIASILRQISGYMGEPLKTVLESGYYEAQALGNTSLALVQMAEKIQHPKFKEIIYNLEITLRYSADFTVLVGQSRKSVREDIRLRRERKNMAGEAWINILILGVMTVVILKAVESLIGVSIMDVIATDFVGRSCVLGICVILLLFGLQVRKILT